MTQGRNKDMISIFQGRKLSLDGTADEIYVQVAVALRDHIHLFSNGKNLNPFGLFMKLALHTDQYGWSYPGRTNIKKSTGITTDAAVTSSLKHLCEMRIEGHSVLAMYRSRDTKWGRTLYRIFPDAWNDGLENVPQEFKSMELVPQYHDDLLVDHLVVDDRHYKYNHSKVEPIKEENTIAIANKSPKQMNAAPITEKSDNSTSPPDCEKKHNEYDKNGKPLNEHQKYFQKIAQAFDFNVDLMTQVDKGRMNKYTKKVKGGGYTLDDIRKAKLHWKEIWPGNTGQSPDESRFTKCLEVVRKQRVEREKLRGGYG